MPDLSGSNGQRTEFRVLGKPNIPGKLSYAIATGKAKFGTDVIVPNLLHAKFLRSPYGHARVKSVNMSKAKALPGVVDIVTWDDPEMKSLVITEEVSLGPVESILLETRAGNAAYGSNGVSHSMANTHLIICAIHHAIGKWIDPPATPDRVLAALGQDN